MNPVGTLHKGRGPQLHVPYPITKSAHSRVPALLPAIGFLGWPWRHQTSCPPSSSHKGNLQDHVSPYSEPASRLAGPGRTLPHQQGGKSPSVLCPSFSSTSLSRVLSSLSPQLACAYPAGLWPLPDAPLPRVPPVLANVLLGPVVTLRP